MLASRSISICFKVLLLLVAGSSVGLGSRTIEPPSDPSEAARLEQAEAIWSGWMARLDEAKYIQIEERCSRVWSLAVNGEASDEVLKASYILAKAFMTEDALLLTVWETDAEWNPQHPNAVLVLAWADNMVTEKMWYPGLGIYRTKRYPSSTHLGPANTEYENGCQFGMLLVTWLGEGERSFQGDQELMKSLAPVVELDPDQSEYALVLKAETARMIDPDSGSLDYQRVDEMFYTADAILTRWVTTVYQAMDDEATKPLRAHPDPYFIVQEQTFEVDFPETAPPEFQQAIDRMMQEEVSD